MGIDAVIETFLNEARDLLEQLETALLDLEVRPNDRELINTTFRALHTLKGSGGMFGPPAMAAFAHELENAFELVRQEEVPMTSKLANILLASTDHLRGLLFEPGADRATESARLVALLQAAVETAPMEIYKAAVGGIPPTAAAASAYKAPEEKPLRRFDITLRLPVNALVNGTNPLGLLDELGALGTAEIVALTQGVPTLAALKPGDLFLGWHISLTTRLLRDSIDDVFIFVDEPGVVTIVERACEQPAQPLQDVEAPAPSVLEDIPAEFAETMPDPQTQEPAQCPSTDIVTAADPMVQAVASPAPTFVPAAAASALQAPLPAASEHRPAAAVPEAKAADPKAAAPDANVRVSAARLDTLLDQVGELVIAQARLTALAHSRRDPVLTAVVEEIERLANDLRDSAMDMRMLPIDSLFGRYRRVVRDLSGDLGKEIDYSYTGEDTELDKTVLDRLGDPLVHIIRNSIDHGIESQEARIAAGKSKRGALKLSARQVGTEIIIAIEDDGAGLNRTRILEKAIANGVVSPDAPITDREIDELIFHPGLSTAAAVSNLSGRGVGMDVVKRTIQELHGSIETETHPGKGTKFILRLPLTLAIIDGLLVRVGPTKCILPLAIVEECVEFASIECRTSNGRNFVDIRGTMVPIVWMDQVFGGTTGDAGIVVVVESDTGKVGIIVDQVVGQHQTVIKPLSPLHRATPGLAGATILGDGSVALILDVNPLTKRANAARSDRLAAA